MTEELADGRVSKRLVAIIIVIALLILSFIIIKPYIAAVLTGIFLAYLFNVPYIKLNKIVKKPGISAAIICIAVTIIIGAAVYFIAQVTIREAFNLYLSIQKMDIFPIIGNFLKNVFNLTPELVNQIQVTMQQAFVALTNTFINSVGKILTNAPQLIIQAFIIMFVFFYFLKEGKRSVSYIKEILPFNAETNERFLKRSRAIASATIFGHIVVGFIQGILVGILFYVFRAPSPLFFTLIAILLGILPFVGPWLVFVPVGLIMITSGSHLNGILLIVVGIVVNTIAGEPLRAVMTGKKAQANPVVVLIGMLGGLTLIGPIGLIVGPLILEYMIIFIDLYKTSKNTSIIKNVVKS